MSSIKKDCNSPGLLGEIVVRYIALSSTIRYNDREGDASFSGPSLALIFTA
jgi:hypothetical protein